MYVYAVRWIATNEEPQCEVFADKEEAQTFESQCIIAGRKMVCFSMQWVFTPKDTTLKMEYHATR
jgi:hypothetical protein